MGRNKKNPWNCIRLQRTYRYVRSVTTMEDKLILDSDIARNCEELAGIFNVGGDYMSWHNFLSRISNAAIATTSLEKIYILAAACTGIPKGEEVFSHSDIRIDGIKVVDFPSKATLHRHLFIILAIAHTHVGSEITVGRMDRVRVEWKSMGYIGHNLLYPASKRGMLRNTVGIGMLQPRDIAIDVSEYLGTAEPGTLDYLETLITRYFGNSTLDPTMIEDFKHDLIRGSGRYDYVFERLNEDWIVSQILLWWQYRRIPRH